jgi:hypothetical protein
LLDEAADAVELLIRDGLVQAQQNSTPARVKPPAQLLKPQRTASRAHRPGWRPASSQAFTLFPRSLLVFAVT